MAKCWAPCARLSLCRRASLCRWTSRGGPRLARMPWPRTQPPPQEGPIHLHHHRLHLAQHPGMASTGRRIPGRTCGPPRGWSTHHASTCPRLGWGCRHRQTPPRAATAPGWRLLEAQIVAGWQPMPSWTGGRARPLGLWSCQAFRVGQAQQAMQWPSPHSSSRTCPAPQRPSPAAAAAAGSCSARRRRRSRAPPPRTPRHPRSMPPPPAHPAALPRLLCSFLPPRLPPARHARPSAALAQPPLH
mmetsp:Transcript_1831/g.4756  ORF Transcript_1831/g.4756 Transcript_1831/m.4756 type:complete len:244 (+) Transcript_1831:297-1028(+)